MQNACGPDGATNDCTICRLKDVKSPKRDPSGITCGFFFALLCRGHLLSETTRGQGADSGYRNRGLLARHVIGWDPHRPHFELELENQLGPQTYRHMTIEFRTPNVLIHPMEMVLQLLVQKSYVTDTDLGHNPRGVPINSWQRRSPVGGRGPPPTLLPEYPS